MQDIILKAKKRDIQKRKGALNRLRKTGLLPGVVYGANTEPIPITLEKGELLGVLNQHGSNVVIYLEVEGKKIPTMIKEIQQHPVSGLYWHVDLNEISLSKKVKTEIPVNFIGEPQGVKKGGVIQYGDVTVEVECLPGDIPEHINLDISELDIGEKITVAQLTAGDKVKIISEPEKIVVTVLAPRMETDDEEIPGEEKVASETPELPEER